MRHTYTKLWNYLMKEKDSPSLGSPFFKFSREKKNTTLAACLAIYRSELLSQGEIGKPCPAVHLCCPLSSHPNASADGCLVACFMEKACIQSFKCQNQYLGSCWLPPQVREYWCYVRPDKL